MARRIARLAISLSLATACGAGHLGDAGDASLATDAGVAADAGAAIVDAGPSCGSCPAGDVCDARGYTATCVPRCASSDSCRTEMPRCDTATGLCGGCQALSDCAGRSDGNTANCERGACRCVSDDNCPCGAECPSGFCSAVYDCSDAGCSPGASCAPATRYGAACGISVCR